VIIEDFRPKKFKSEIVGTFDVKFDAYQEMGRKKSSRINIGFCYTHDTQYILRHFLKYIAYKLITLVLDCFVT